LHPVWAMGKLNAAAEGYDSAWAKTRADYLRRHPLCGECGKPAKHVHHRISRRVLVAQGVANPNADCWLEGLCVRDHMRETAQDRSRR
jgi:5-methylcytosine-specific restriction endonuclease McrA